MQTPLQSAARVLFLVPGLSFLLAGCASSKSTHTKAGPAPVALRDCGVIGVISTSQVPNIFIQRPYTKHAAAHEMASNKAIQNVASHLDPNPVSGFILLPFIATSIVKLVSAPVVGSAIGLTEE